MGQRSKSKSNPNTFYSLQSTALHSSFIIQIIHHHLHLLSHDVPPLSYLSDGVAVTKHAERNMQQQKLWSLLLLLRALLHSATMVNEAQLLQRASGFIMNRNLGSDMIKCYLADEPTGYQRNGKDQKSFVDFIVKYRFPFTVEFLQASIIKGKHSVEIKYKPGLLIARETLHFQPSDDKIFGVQTIYTDGVFDESAFVPRNVPTDKSKTDDADAHKSASILRLATNFLEADVVQDIERQRALLSSDATAFGARGLENIIAAQMDGIKAGTTYSLPFPIQVNIHANCVSLDFYSHNNGLTERGTEIFYFDLNDEKVVRIDTLRHTLSQPAWVKQHFTT